MIRRLTLTGDTIIVHDGLSERAPTPDEAEQIRGALEAKRLPWWFEYGVVAFGFVALCVLARGGGQ